MLFLLAVIMGGRKSRIGSMIGAGIIVLLPKLLDDIDAFRWVAILLAVAVLASGVVAVRRGKSTAPLMAIPVVGTIALAGLSFWLDSMTDWRLSIFGLITLFVVYYLQDGIVGFVRSALNVKRVKPGEHDVATAAHIPADAVSHAAKADNAGTAPELLEARGVLMQFGGLKALNNVDLIVRRGTIHGLIGPNGSGKSTMMNVLTGIYVPTAGTIRFQGDSVVGRTSSSIALSGIARTFQNVQLFGEMTALQNVQVGLHHTFHSNVADVALATPRYRREDHAAAERGLGLLRFVGLEHLALEEARNLPYGKQRLLEIARALALDPQLLLLDEPAAGLTAPDIIELLAIIRKIREHGVTVILIEHHHGRRDEHVRHRLGARLRPEDLRGSACRGSEGRQGHRGLSRGAGSMSDSMLTIDKLVAGYGKVQVLHGISMQVPKGQVVTLIGSNGAGKTTTMRAISGMIKPPRAPSI